MRVPFCILYWLDRRLRRVAFSREPDFVIGGAESPYLNRWRVIPRNRFFNIYLHQILRSDDARALHDHPWMNLSIVLRGIYREVVGDPGAPHIESTQRKFLRGAGDVVLRLPSTAHRLEVVTESKGAWSLFFTGPVVQEWGFYCEWGWRHWREFTAPDDSGKVGRGCE